MANKRYLATQERFENTSVGRLALAANTMGGYNTATGSNALRNNTDASYNTANGAYTLHEQHHRPIQHRCRLCFAV